MQNFKSLGQTVWSGEPGQTHTHTNKRIKREEYLRHFSLFYKLVLNSGYGDSITINNLIIYVLPHIIPIISSYHPFVIVKTIV